MIKRGSTGPEVKGLQLTLNNRGWRLTCDGQFGAKTEAAVRDFQLASGLGADGIVGPATWAALRESPAQEYVEGIDVSGWQRGLDWDKCGATQRFVWVKATQGESSVSSGLRRHWQPAGAAGLLRGVYHFADLRFGGLKRPWKQAEHFAKHHPHDAELPAALDLESGGFKGLPGNWDQKIVDWSLEWLARVKVLTGRDPIVYTGYPTWKFKLGETDMLASFKLWQADYSDPINIIPPWGLPLIHQWTGHGHVVGYDGEIDRNRFRGSYNDLCAWVGHVPLQG